MIFIYRQGQKSFLLPFWGSLWNVGPAELCILAECHAPVKLAENKKSRYKRNNLETFCMLEQLGWVVVEFGFYYNWFLHL